MCILDDIKNDLNGMHTKLQILTIDADRSTLFTFFAADDQINSPSIKRMHARILAICWEYWLIFLIYTARYSFDRDLITISLYSY